MLADSVAILASPAFPQTLQLFHSGVDLEPLAIKAVVSRTIAPEQGMPTP
jgi:hypothetical protein